MIHGVIHHREPTTEGIVASDAAVILAGGRGTRLRPLTLARPKAILPLLGRPFIQYQLAFLRHYGLRNVVVACSYRAEAIRSALGDGRGLGVSLRYAVEAEPLGTAGAVRHAAALTQGRLIVLNGDILTALDLPAMIGFHEASRARVTLHLTCVENPGPYGLVETGRDGRVQRFVEKPPHEAGAAAVNAGVYVFEREVLEWIPAGQPISLEREVFPEILARGIAMSAFVADGYWIDVGTPANYRRAQRDLLGGAAAVPLP